MVLVEGGSLKIIIGTVTTVLAITGIGINHSVRNTKEHTSMREERVNGDKEVLIVVTDIQKQQGKFDGRQEMLIDTVKRIEAKL